MGTWIWLSLVVVAALAVFALVWWSSGRAKVGGRNPDDVVTPEQRAMRDYNSIETSRNRDGLAGPFG